MKKTIAFFLVTVFLLSMPLCVNATVSAYLSGPNTVRAGDIITITLYAGGGIGGGNGVLSYDSSQLTLQSWTSSLSAPWEVSFNGNTFLFFDDSTINPISGTAAIFKLKFKVSDSLAAGTNISVSVSSLTLSDGNSDSHLGTRSYQATIAEPLSGNANLSKLEVSNAEIYPAFSPTTTAYNTSVPFTTTALLVSAEPEHPNAQVSISSPTLPAGGTGKVSVTVTAENGTTKVYTIYAARQQDPNYIPSSDTSLMELSVEGFPLSPLFSSEQSAYAVYVPNEVTSDKVIAAPTDKKASVTVPDGKDLAAGENILEIPVKAENGDILTYALHVFRAEVFPPVTEPTEPATEPVTEPATEPVTEPATEPATEPIAEPATKPDAASDPSPENNDGSLWKYFVVGGASFGGGCLITGLVLFLCKKLKKKKEKNTE